MKLLSNADTSAPSTTAAAGSILFAPGELRGFVRALLEQIVRRAADRLPRVVRWLLSADRLTDLALAAFDHFWPSGEPLPEGATAA
jgi:hypothetical protein